MINLEQIRLLESRITRALELIRILKEENSTLRRGLESAQKRMRELENLVDGFKTDQKEIESIIVRTLHNLDDLEETAAAGAATAPGSPGAAAGSPGAAAGSPSTAQAAGQAGLAGNPAADGHSRRGERATERSTERSAERATERPPAAATTTAGAPARPATPAERAGDQTDASQKEELDIF